MSSCLGRCRPALERRWIAVGFVGVVPLLAGSPPSPNSTAAGTAPAHVRPFADGVRINWTDLEVEVDARIALREGPIELLACSPGTKEHESILVVAARATHIYQALGLVGLEPGSPPVWDELHQRWMAARGAGLDVRVRCKTDSPSVVVPSFKWVTYAEEPRGQSPPMLPWVFAGSAVLPDGRLAAEVEGTVAAVVDFDTSLLGLASTHTASDPELWLVANTEFIPPRGTLCELLIRSAHRPTVEIAIRADGTILRDDQPIELGELLALLKPAPSDTRPGRLRVCQQAETSDQTRDRILSAVSRLGLDMTTETKRPPCHFDPGPRR